MTVVPTDGEQNVKGEKHRPERIVLISRHLDVAALSHRLGCVL